MNALFIAAVILSIENGTTEPFLLIMLFIFVNLLFFYFLFIYEKSILCFPENKKSAQRHILPMDTLTGFNPVLTLKTLIVKTNHDTNIYIILLYI